MDALADDMRAMVERVKEDTDSRSRQYMQESMDVMDNKLVGLVWEEGKAGCQDLRPHIVILCLLPFLCGVEARQCLVPTSHPPLPARRPT